MQSDDPAFLPVGTEVSAKFKGAFCEAKVKKIARTVKLRVSLKEQPFGNIQVDDSAIKSGNLVLNELVEVQHGKHLVKGTIAHIKDCSSYHVVFNDGDEKTLRRTQMCLKGAKHFDAAVNLDAMPLYNPEQFSSPVVKGGKKPKKRKGDDGSPSKRAKRRKGDEEDDSDDEKGKKREKRAAASAATVAIGEMDQGETELSGEASSIGDASDAEKEKEKERVKKEEEKVEERREKEKKATPVKSRDDDKKPKKLDVGEVVSVRETTNPSSKWYPAVIVSPKAFKKALPKAKTLAKKEVSVRSFQNGKYFAVENSLVFPFNEQLVGKKSHDSLSTALKTAVDRAQSFLDKEALPGNWDHSEIFGESGPSTSKKDEQVDKSKEKQKKKEDDKEKKKEDDKEKKKDEKKKEKKVAETESSSSESSGEEDYGEERDIFVAQLYKFQEERGTPINRAPVLGGKDIDLYRFYRVVQHYGGLKKATANGKWKKILVRMKLEGCAGATPVTVKNAYSRYLAHFNSFYKRLGWSLDELVSTTTINSPRERRLIRPQNVENKVKRRKSNVEVKEKEKAKKKEDENKEKEPQPSTSKAEDSVLEPSEIKEVASVEEDKQSIHSEGTERTKAVDKKKIEKEKKNAEMLPESPSVEIPQPPPVKERRDSVRSVSDKKEKKEKLAKDSDSERSRDKETKKDKKDIESEEDAPSEGKKRKEKRKMSMKSPKFDLEPMYEDDEPGYVQPDILQNFRMGQSVRSFHHGRWYDARVINIDETLKLEERIELVTLSSGEDPINPSLEFKNKLINVMRKNRCLVHYLGWNSRYDELMPLNKVRVSLKDESASFELIRNGGKNKISEERMQWIVNWSHSPGGVASMPLDFDRTTPTPNINFMNGYRPRRVSISQIEQINAAVEGLKREQNKVAQGVISPSPSVMSSPSSSSYSVKILPTSSKKEEVETPKPCTSTTITEVAKEYSKSPSTTSSIMKSPVSDSPCPSAKSPVSESRRTRTTSRSKDSPVSIATPSVVSRSSPPVVRSVTPISCTTEIVTEEVPMILERASPVNTEVIPQSEVVVQEHRVEINESFSVVELCEDVASDTRVETDPIFEASVVHTHIATPPPSFQEVVFQADQEMVVESVVECVSSEDSSKTTPLLLPEEQIDITCIEDHNLESTSQEVFTQDLVPVPEPEPVEAEPEPEAEMEMDDSEINSAKLEEELLDEARNECLKLHPDDDVHSEVGRSGSETPHRTDAEDIDSEKVEDPVGRIVSPSSRGRGMKRKRFAHRHSQMVVDRKYMKHKSKDLDKKDRDDGSDEEELEEEEGTVARTTFIKKKNLMHKQMEQEKSLHDVSFLGLQKIEDYLHLPVDDIIQVCSQRLEEMREMYLQARHDIQMVEKRWKAQTERKKEKEKALQKERECPSTPSLLSSTISGEKSDSSK